MVQRMTENANENDNLSTLSFMYEIWVNCADLVKNCKCVSIHKLHI